MTTMTTTTIPTITTDTPAASLSWEWREEGRDSFYEAKYRGLTIRAHQDDHPENPLESWGGNWPALVCFDRRISEHSGDYKYRVSLPLQDSHVSDELVVHLQHLLARVFDASVQELLEHHCANIDLVAAEDDGWEYPKHVTDAGVLRDVFMDAISGTGESERLAVLEQIYDLLHIPCYRTTSRGYSQGDWAELLVVGPRGVARKFGWADDRAVTEDDLRGTADLWSAWAWGDVYGYVVGRMVPDPDADPDADPDDVEEVFEELDDGSCWGFYGDDFAESGLEEAAREVADYELDHTSSHAPASGCNTVKGG